ncbi:hypothetical protein K1T73_10925 [Roseovarius sp. SCSIO 43702]|uniref:hypothetical protein n=1 Tax=Roseovarius sp. SCSIO 43702 TaxID=2823043 RepID=UPI001C73669D|nr:hypothetical protein [Roseovarius sp. SCSIO 43702]QYX55603.1 hypothetical protein K1T73_10925 [Roseovarius sp. SCSIO 43702]
MELRLILAAVLSPFLVAFIYAGFHEYLRFKSEGRADYGLQYDDETGTTHVTSIPEDEDGYDPAEFDPRAANADDDKRT